MKPWELDSWRGRGARAANVGGLSVSFPGPISSILLAALLLLSPLPARAQYYDSTVKASAEDYLQQVVETAGAEALDKYPRGDVLYLAGTLGQMDRPSIPADVFIGHLEVATSVRNRFYPDIPQESYRQYILALRIRSEFTSHSGWSRRLNAELMQLIGEGTDITKAANLVFAWVRGKVKLDGETRTYQLNLKGDLDPLTTLRGGRGNEIDIAILAVASLRSVGIASRIVYAPVIANEKGGKVWVEYRDSKEWVPWVPSAPSAPPVESAKAWLTREFRGEWAYILANPEQPVNITGTYVQPVSLWLCPHPLSIDKFDGTPMIFSNGRLQPVTGRDLYNPEPENASVGMGAGPYVIVSGDRTTLGGIKPVVLAGDQPGWYQMNFESKIQQFATGKSKPDFFEWLPDAAASTANW